MEGQLNRLFLQTRFQAVVALAMAACLCAPPRLAGQSDAHAQASRGQVGAQRAAAWLEKQVDAEGIVAGEFPEENIRYGGRTALAAWALLSAGRKPRGEDSLARALGRLEKLPRRSVYAVSMRICALAEANRPSGHEILLEDTRWLLKAMTDRGAYTYTPPDDAAKGAYDNSNTLMAVLAVYAAQQAGVEVPLAWWQKVEDHWLAQQQIDGGWAYRIPPGAVRARSYGSMSAAGTASLLICDDVLHRDDFIRCIRAERSEPIRQGLDWLGKNFAADRNPSKGVEWYYYWLFCAQRAGLLAGQKRFGQADWRSQMLRHVLARQGRDGAMGYGDRVSKTAWSLMILTQGRAGVLLNKLQYTGKWNARPRDAAHLAGWFSRQFESPCRWQSIDLAENPQDLYDAPIAYLSGAGAAAFTEEQIAALGRYVLAGGLIISESACSNGDFTLDMQRTYRRMFPEKPLERLPADAPIYNLSRELEDPPGAWAVRGGTRLWAIHLPQEVSLGLQTGEPEAHRATYDLLANLCLYATNFQDVRPIEPAPEVSELLAPTRTVRLALIKHEANWNPEPFAVRRLGNHLADRNIRLVLSEPMDVAKLEAEAWPAARLSGTGELDFTPEQIGKLKSYLEAGGTLLVDSAGGSETFSRSFRRILPQLSQIAPVALPANHAVYSSGPHRIGQVGYRRPRTDQPIAETTSRPRLIGVTDKDRTLVFFSPEDLTAGLAGVRAPTVAGYKPEDAIRIYANLVVHSAVKAEAGENTAGPAK